MKYTAYMTENQGMVHRRMPFFHQIRTGDTGRSGFGIMGGMFLRFRNGDTVSASALKEIHTTSQNGWKFIKRLTPSFYRSWTPQRQGKK